MRKKVYVVLDDFYHKKEVIDIMLSKLFNADDYDVFKTAHMRELLPKDVKPDLMMFFTNGRTDDEPELTFAEQEVIVQKVFEGSGIIFYHAGLVLIESNSPYMTKLNSGRFITHPDKCNVKVTPLGNVAHPITNGVLPFAEYDEHYFCNVDISATCLLACADSEHGTTASVWCHSYGNGRVVGITQGHTEEMQNNENMLRLTHNAVNWATKQEENE